MRIIRTGSDLLISVKFFDAFGQRIPLSYVQSVTMKLYTDEPKTQYVSFSLSDIDDEKEILSVTATQLNTLNTGVLYMSYAGKYRCTELDDTTYDFSNEDQLEVFFINDNKQYGTTCATNVSELINDADYVSRSWVNHHMLTDEHLDASLNEFRTNLDSSFASFRTDIDSSFGTLKSELESHIDSSIAAAVTQIDTAVAAMESHIDSSISAAITQIDTAVTAMEAHIDASILQMEAQIDEDVSIGIQWVYDQINANVISDEFINSLN